MRPYKSHKIDTNNEYPCPCRRKGRLIPITLTEAFGCDRCQQIFALDENGQIIEQVTSTYPYKKTWRWNGSKWISTNSPVKETYLPVALGIIMMLLVIWLPLALRSSSPVSIILWMVIALLLAVLPALMVWLAYRR